MGLTIADQGRQGRPPFAPKTSSPEGSTPALGVSWPAQQRGGDWNPELALPPTRWSSGRWVGVPADGLVAIETGKVRPGVERVKVPAGGLGVRSAVLVSPGWDVDVEPASA